MEAKLPLAPIVVAYFAIVSYRTTVLDRGSRNQLPASSYDIGGCDGCIEHWNQNEDADLHAQRRQPLKEEDPECKVDDVEDLSTQCVRPAYQRNTNDLPANFTDALLTWQEQMFLEDIERCYTSLKHIMTQKALTE